MGIKQEINEPLLYDYIANIPNSLLGNHFDEYIPKIDKRMIEAGVITRYFIRQVNHRSGYITEISQGTFDSFKGNNLYATVLLPWRISGKLEDEFGPKNGQLVRLYTGLKTSNTLSLKDAEVVISGISRKINNVMQFYVS